MRNMLLGTVSWILSLGIGFTAFFIGKQIYYEQFNKVIATIKSHNIEQLANYEYWIAIAVPIIMFVLGVAVARIVVNIVVKLLGKVLFLV